VGGVGASDQPSGFSSTDEIERVCMRNLLANLEERVRVFFKDRESRFLLVSAGWLAAEGQGRSFEDVIGKTDFDIFSPAHAAAAFEDERRVIATGEPMIGKVECETYGDRPDVWVETSKLALRETQGKIVGVWGITRDITGQVAAEQALAHQSLILRSVVDNTPAMISVKGRDSRYQLVNREFERFFRVSGDWIVGRGDEHILPASAIDAIHATDQLVLGGQTTQEEETALRDSQERVFLTTRFPLRDHHGEVQAVGVMSTDITERRREERFKRERLECSERIHSALAQNRFVLHGQPIVNLASMQIEHSELLIRMLNVGGGKDLVAPAEFLPAAEHFDLIHLVDEWMVDRAVEIAAAGHRVAVNLSAKTICDPAQVERIERTILTSGAPPQNLTIELTETAAANNFEAARTFALRLHKLGCAFALDDFGVGHGTFSYLRHLRVDYLKIDAQFVRDLLLDEEDRQVVRAIIGVAREFKIKTIAEGVETQATLDELRRLGVDYAQGYCIARPVPLPQLWQQTKDRGGDVHAAQATARQGTERDRS
jgi:PAS domain S-box-containing protein